MTRISEIHGIGQNEFADRGAMVKPNGFFPYLSLTQGEAKLWLAAQRAKTLAQWYGSDGPQYAQAAQMLDNALHADISKGVHFVGAVPDYLQPVAQLIRKASRETRPASKLYLKPTGSVHGIGQIIPYQDRLKACLDAAKKLPALKQAAAFAKCQRAFEKEKIINAHIVDMSPHMLYKDIPKGFRIPTDVETHRTLHRLGVEGIAGVAQITDYDLVYQWIENGILQKNTQGGAGAIGSVQSSFSLAPNADELIAKWTQDVVNAQKQRQGISGARIGIAPALVAAIVSVVTAAIGAAFNYLTEIRKTELLAMSEARGFGTPEFSANKKQWEGLDLTTAGGLDTTTLLLIGGAALLLLANDDN